MLNGAISIEQIVENVCNGNPGFRVHICEKAMESFVEQGTIPDSLLFYALAVRLHEARHTPQNIRNHLIGIASAVNKNGH